LPPYTSRKTSQIWRRKGENCQNKEEKEAELTQFCHSPPPSTPYSEAFRVLGNFYL
jgi:hypothetical protein